MCIYDTSHQLANIPAVAHASRVEPIIIYVTLYPHKRGAGRPLDLKFFLHVRRSNNMARPDRTFCILSCPSPTHPPTLMTEQILVLQHDEANVVPGKLQLLPLLEH
jgi:hypothetical protein